MLKLFNIVALLVATQAYELCDLGASNIQTTCSGDNCDLDTWMPCHLRSSRYGWACVPTGAGDAVPDSYCVPHARRLSEVHSFGVEQVYRGNTYKLVHQETATPGADEYDDHATAVDVASALSNVCNIFPGCGLRFTGGADNSEYFTYNESTIADARRLSEFLKPNWSINRSGQGVRSFSGSATHIVDDDVAKVTPDGGSSWWFARDGNFLKEVTKEDGTLADNLVVGGNTLDVKPLVDQGFSFANRRLSEEESEDEPPTFMSLGYGVVINGASTTTAPVYQTSDCAKKVFVVASSLIHAGATTTCVSGCCA